MYSFLFHQCCVFLLSACSVGRSIELISSDQLVPDPTGHSNFSPPAVPVSKATKLCQFVQKSSICSDANEEQSIWIIPGNKLGVQAQKLEFKATGPDGPNFLHILFEKYDKYGHCFYQIQEYVIRDSKFDCIHFTHVCETHGCWNKEGLLHKLAGINSSNFGENEVQRFRNWPSAFNFRRPNVPHWYRMLYTPYEGRIWVPVQQPTEEEDSENSKGRLLFWGCLIFVVLGSAALFLFEDASRTSHVPDVASEQRHLLGQSLSESRSFTSLAGHYGSGTLTNQTESPAITGNGTQSLVAGEFTPHLNSESTSLYSVNSIHNDAEERCCTPLPPYDGQDDLPTYDETMKNYEGS